MQRVADGLRTQSLPICCSKVHTLNSVSIVHFLQRTPDSDDLEISVRVAFIFRCMNLSQILGKYRITLVAGLLSNINIHFVSLR
jgi:hypothetical protein